MVWQTIDTAPKTSLSRLVWCPERQNIYLVSWDEYREQWVYFGGCGVLDQTPTHWSPLPEAPEAA